MASNHSLELAAQAWCEPSTGHIVMQPDLAKAFAEILDRELGVMVKACQMAIEEIDGTKAKTDGPIGTLMVLRSAIDWAEGRTPAPQPATRAK